MTEKYDIFELGDKINELLLQIGGAGGDANIKRELEKAAKAAVTAKVKKVLEGGAKPVGEPGEQRTNSGKIMSLKDEIQARIDARKKLKSQMGKNPITHNEKFTLEDNTKYQILKTDGTFSWGFNFKNAENTPEKQRFELHFSMGGGVYENFLDFLANRGGTAQDSAKTFYGKVVEAFGGKTKEEQEKYKKEFRKTRVLISPKFGDTDFIKLLKEKYTEKDLNLTEQHHIKSDTKPPRIHVFNMKSGKPDSLKIGFAWEDKPTKNGTNRRLIIPGLDDTGGPSALEFGKIENKDFELNKQFKYFVANTKPATKPEVTAFLEKGFGGTSNSTKFLNKHAFVNKDKTADPEGKNKLLKYNKEFLSQANINSYKSNEVVYYMYQEELPFNRYVIPAKDAVKLAGSKMYYRKWGEDIDAEDTEKLEKFALHIDALHIDTNDELKKYKPEDFNAGFLEQLNNSPSLESATTTAAAT
jgi:hypothetical protein